jgi:TolA-binding protein
MTRDLLEQAKRALSESGHEQRGARFTRERLMASLHERKRRGKSRFAVLLPLAAIFVGSTAFAAATGQLSGVVSSALSIIGMEAATVAPAEQARPRALRAGKAAALPSGVRPAPPDPKPAEVSRDSVAQSEKPGGASDQVNPVENLVGGSVASRQHAALAPAPALAPSAEDDGHAIYRRAHAAHFREGDVGAALEAYGEYLAGHPAGRFSVDARYNRALCLVRLGRVAEARETLEKFANGAYGGYRQADAQRLLGALGDLERRRR